MNNNQISKELARLLKFLKDKDRKPIKNISLHVGVVEHSDSGLLPVCCETVITTKDCQISVFLPENIVKPMSDIIVEILNPLLQEAKDNEQK
ncbi:MAG: hypothetical protein PQ612_06490 [Rickettsiales bacterium]|nr:hypothetical protein [Pseudomonadota bacterium]MDA0966621.1 hypothetical protein [Pseudomonadota bacterium]MDG4543649.1 hypothetical protein [Rickettsiales bacterium]MDG4545796.1 hypothetical protein [Rickettsiales bacterium]MDG4547430.1 hypothetical protein [Rickettsiales bacterium]